MNDLLCATDLTAASDTAMVHALALADRFGASVSLLHVLGKAERSPEKRDQVHAAMLAQVAAAGGNERVRIQLQEGDFMDAITEESGKGHRLAVMGTHGSRGLRQSLFGADMLKLVRRCQCPCFVVQEASAKDGGIERIVLPVASHATIDRLLQAVCDLARAFGSEVHVFQLIRPGEQPSDELLRNKLAMLERLQREGIPHVEANVPQSGFSVGFAGATIEYARQVGAGAIAIMAHASEEYRYIADAEKERILANPEHIPVLCA